MSVPTWDQYMAPSLRVMLDGEIYRNRAIVEGAAEVLGLSDEQREITIPSGQEQWLNRGKWEVTYLNRAGAIERTSRAHYRITDVGRKLIKDHPDGITERDLRALSGDVNAPHTFKAFPRPGIEGADQESKGETALEPQEQIELGIARIHADVADALLERILAQEPVFF